MKPTHRRLGVACLTALTMLAAGCGTVAKMPAPGVAAAGPALRILAFYDQSTVKPSGTVEQLLVSNRTAISDLAPLWYSVQADGSVRAKSQGHIKAWAQSENIKLMPLVVNGYATSTFLLDATDRSRAVAALVHIVKTENYAGLNIDFEQIKTAARQPFVVFMQQLHQQLGAMHKLLSIDIIPSGSKRAANKGAYNYAALAKNADEVVLMTYDEHDNTSRPGPIATLSWVRKRINVALSDGVPKDRLMMGIADYGYDWPARAGGGYGRGTELGLNQIDQILAAQHITPTRSGAGEPHFSYTRHGVTHVVWYEDGRSVLPKIALARKDGLEGLALWMAGFETADYWHAVRAAAGTGPATASATSSTNGGKSAAKSTAGGGRGTTSPASAAKQKSARSSTASSGAGGAKASGGSAGAGASTASGKSSVGTPKRSTAGNAATTANAQPSVPTYA